MTAMQQSQQFPAITGSDEMENEIYETAAERYNQAWIAYDEARDASWDKYTAMGYKSLDARDQARRDHADLYTEYLAAREVVVALRRGVA